MYNKNVEENENEFRRIQEESRRKSFESVRKQDTHIASNERLRERFSKIIKGWLDNRRVNSSNFELLNLSSNKGTKFNLYKNIDGQTFHDVFEIASKYLMYGELVGL